MTDYGMMFKLDNEVAYPDHFPDDCEIYINNCQNTLLNRFSPQKTYGIELYTDIGFLIVPVINKDTLMRLGGATK